MKNKVFVIAILFLVIIAGYFWYKNQQFSVEYTICSSGYKDCFVSAKYKDINDCESVREMGNWRCDSLTDPNNVICKPAVDSLVVSYCRN